MSIYDDLRPLVADKVLHYGGGYEDALSLCEEQGLGADDLESMLAESNIEKCPGCDAYVDAGELLPVDGSDEPDGHCCECRPKGA